MMESKQLSCSWGESKEGEDLLLANTYINSKKPEGVGVGVKKNSRKKISWD